MVMQATTVAVCILIKLHSLGINKLMKKFTSFAIISAVPIIIGIIIGLNISYFDPFFKLNFNNQNTVHDKIRYSKDIG